MCMEQQGDSCRSEGPPNSRAASGARAPVPVEEAKNEGAGRALEGVWRGVILSLAGSCVKLPDGSLLSVFCDSPPAFSATRLSHCQMQISH